MYAPQFPPGIEPLEARIAPASFVVTTAADSGPGSLRQAILDANALPGSDSIGFSMSAKAVIKLATHLPAITDRVTITGPVGSTKIAIDGTAAAGADGPNNGSGLMLSGSTSSYSTISGLAIYGFDIAGIEIVNSSGNSIHSNYLGIDGNGLSVAKRMVHGVLVSGGDSNKIGNSKLGNTIGGNDYGIRVTGSASATSIDGNSIGAFPNSYFSPRSNEIGVLIENASRTKIGEFAGNKIQHNRNIGIKLTGSATDTTIAYNTIGGYGYGSEALSYQEWGIFIDGARNTTIGAGTFTNQGKSGGNTIAGNSAGGIWLRLGSAYSFDRIEGNIIGNKDVLEWSLGNGGPGILVTRTNLGDTQSPTLVIGSNLISGNSGAGIELRGAGSKFVAGINSNVIGMDFNGLKPLGNGTGIIIDGTDNVTIGGLGAKANTITASALDGILINSSSNITLSGNHIGIAPKTPESPGMGNGAHGIHLGAAGKINIGANIIGFNGQDGIFLDGDAPSPQKLVPNISIFANFVGTDKATQKGNDDAGIHISDLDENGKVKIDGGNVIDGAFGVGIRIERSNGVEITENVVSSHYAALELADAVSTIVLENEFHSEASEAVLFERGTQGTIFGRLEEGNLVTSDSSTALLVKDGHDNTIVGNRFESPVSGVSILNGENNPVSRNQFAVPDDGLFVDLGGDGFTLNDPLDADSGPNTLQNSPLLFSAAVRGGQTLLRGEYRGLANVDVRIEWYVGGQFAAELNVHTDENGTAKLILDLDREIDPGTTISASATVASNTSEFSPGVIATTPPEVIAKGAARGHKPRIQLSDAVTGDLVMNLLAFGKAHRGGVSVTTADVDGDGFSDLIAVSRTGSAVVKIFSGIDGHEISQFSAGAGAGARSIVAGDLDRDGTIEVVVGRSKMTGGPITIHDALTGTPEGRYTPFGFNSPARLKLDLADTDGDELPEIVIRTELRGDLRRIVLDPISGQIERVVQLVRA